MLLALEVRWFVAGPLPAAVQAWFDGLGPGVAVEARTDRYLVPVESDEVGLKVREGRVEAKQQVERHAPVRWGRAEAAPEVWRKWSLGSGGGDALGAGWVDVAKARQQRWAPRVEGSACALELSRVTVGDETWWSVCLEAQGADAATRLDAFALRTLDRPEAPALPLDAARSYPAWLRDLA